MKYRKVFKNSRHFVRMDNIDDPETAAKISDSAYSNSCSNSQSRRSHSSKSTHSGSNSSGSSGYGGKASTSGSSNILGQPPKKADKDSKKKKVSQNEVKVAEAVPPDEPARSPEPDPIVAPSKEETDNVVESTPVVPSPEMIIDDIHPAISEPSNENIEALNTLQPVGDENYVTSCPITDCNGEGFSCVISMHDGVVMYTSASLTAMLGFPKEIWVGRSFIDFVHPRDHKIFASLITNGLAFPKLEPGKDENNILVTRVRGPELVSGSTMVCRLRCYRSLNLNGFGIKDIVVSYMPFLLKFFFKDYSDDDLKVVCLVIQASPFSSAFKIPNEVISNPISFMTRHTADGILEYIDSDSVPYLGYLPQDIQDKNALNLYHPDDLPYLKHVYETIVKEGSFCSSKPYRLLAQNGDYIRVETEWSSVINPWSMKLEFVIAKHNIMEGPNNPDVFQSPELTKSVKISEVDKYRLQAFRDSIMRVMNETRIKPAEAIKQQINKRSQSLASFMETLVEETPKQDEELKLDIQEIQERDLNYYERDSVMLGGISPHHDSDSKSSIETPLSYNQLNYNENLQRYFDSQELYCSENIPADGPVSHGQRALKAYASKRSLSPLAQDSGEFNELSSNSSAVGVYSPGPTAPCDHQPYLRLTETVIYKHNADMEKELVLMHRESRSSKGDREKAVNESRKKKKEHLARCNASFYPTSAGDAMMVHRKHSARGVKRGLQPPYDDAHAQKHHCPSSHESHGQHYPTSAASPYKPAVTLGATVAASQWPSSQNVNGFNMFSIGIPQQMPLLAHVRQLSDQQKMSTMQSGPSDPSSTPMPGTSSMSVTDTARTPMPGTSSAPVTDTAHMPMPSTSRMPMPSTSRMPMPGTSSMNMPGPSSMPMPGTSRMNMPGPSSMPMPGTSSMPMPGTSRMNMPGPSSMNMPGPSSMPMPGTSRMNMPPSSMPMPGTSRMNMPGSSSMPMPGTSRMNMPGPSSMLMSGTSRMNMPGPSSMPMPGTSRMNMPGTSRMNLPGPSSMHMPGTSRMPISMPGTFRMPMPGTYTMPMPGTSSMPMPGTSTSNKSRMEPMSDASGISTMTGTYTMPGMPTVPVMPGMQAGVYPVYFAPTGTPMTPMPPNSQQEGYPAVSSYQTPMQYMMQGPAIQMMYGQPFVYSPINPEMYPAQENQLTEQTMQYSDSLNLTTSNYEQSSNFLDTFYTQCEKPKDTRTSDENAERTDGESSYSSFYSSFFRTDSGSADDSGDQKNKSNAVKNRFWTKNVQGEDAMSFQSSSETTARHSSTKNNTRKLARRKMSAPWNEEVNLTSELIYKYQIMPKPLEEVLAEDKNKLATMDKQPALVNEQLGRLYLDLQLQGVAARLTLEEGITSSSSSGEDNIPNASVRKRKREFSKLAIIHEENAPFPAPGTEPLVPEGQPDEDTGSSEFSATFIT